MSLDPDISQLLALRIDMNLPFFQDLTPDQARQAIAAARAALQQPPPVVGSVRDMSIPGPAGALALRIYCPSQVPDRKNLPAIIFFHGGGWVLGDLDSHDVLCRQLTNAGNCCVIAVDYRLAPEHRFPAAIEDAQAAVRYVFEHHERLAIDRTRIAVGGDSAGGNIAAVMALLARDGVLPAVRYQILIYPCLDMTMSRRSYDVAADGLTVTAETMFWFRGHYLSRAEDQMDFRASPLFAPCLEGVAPAYLLAAGYDPLLDEGDAYVRRLRQAGVNVTYRNYPGQIHGFVTMGATLPTSIDAIANLGAALRSALSPP